MAELTKEQQKAIALARARLALKHGGNYLHPNDLQEAPAAAAPAGAPDPGLNVPGVNYQRPEGAPPVNVNPPTQHFGISASDTLNPIPAIAAGMDSAAGAVPIIGPKLQEGRDLLNARIHGDTPEAARTAMNETVRQNPEASAVGTVVGRVAPYLAAASNPLTAGALGLEGSLGLRFLMGGLSSEAINVADQSARGKDPMAAVQEGTKETILGLPFYALGSNGTKGGTIKSAPTVANLKEQAAPLYKAAEDSGVVFSQPAVQQFIDGTTSAAMKKGLDPTLTKQSVAAIKRMYEVAGRNMSMADAMQIRKVLGNAAQKSLDTSDADHAIAVGLLRDFDTFLEGATQPGSPALLQGTNAAAAHDALVTANKLWSAASKGEMLDKAVELAVATSKSKDVPLDRAIRDRFGAIEQQIIKGDLPGFSPDEIKLIQDVAHGTGSQKIADFVGKAKSGGPAGIGGAAAAGYVGTGNNVLGGVAGGSIAALGMPLGATGRAIARNISRTNADYAGAAIRNSALGNGSIQGALTSSGRVAASIPAIAGRTAVTMTLRDWSNANGQ